MGHCISDNTDNDDRKQTVKFVSVPPHNYHAHLADVSTDKLDDGAPGEEEFYKKRMNENVVQEVESFKRAQFSDGLVKQDMTKSITTIQY